jgi:hypothetical protein
MEEINSENKMDCELTNYQLYCDRVKLFNKKVIELDEECELILNKFDLQMTNKYHLMTFNELEIIQNYICNIKKSSLICFNSKNYIYDSDGENPTVNQWWNLTYQEDKYEKSILNIEKFNKEIEIYNLFF